MHQAVPSTQDVRVSVVSTMWRFGPAVTVSMAPTWAKGQG